MNGMMDLIDIMLIVILIATFIWMAYSVLSDKPEETETEKMLRERAEKKISNKGPDSWPFPTAETVKPKRARTKKGHYVKDDPSTVENEAWVGGKAPADKPKKPKKKSTTTTKKSTTVKKKTTTTATKKRKPKAKKETS
jgi:hypothetical protein